MTTTRQKKIVQGDLTLVRVRVQRGRRGWSEAYLKDKAGNEYTMRLRFLEKQLPYLLAGQISGTFVATPCTWREDNPKYDWKNPDPKEHYYVTKEGYDLRPYKDLPFELI